MSLSTALNSAFSGLQVTSRGTQVVADNIANAGSEGYAVRTLNQAPRTIGAQGSGVVVTGVTRDSAPVLLDNLRQSNSALAGAESRATFWRDMEQALGLTGSPDGLATRIQSLESALTQAATTPDSLAALAMTVQAALDVALAFQYADAQINRARDQADAQLAQGVQSLNTLLDQIAVLNTEITKQSIIGADANALVDQRQLLISKVSEFLPVKEIPREFGRVLILAMDGTVLVDHTAVKFEFQRNPTPSPEQRVSDGTLSALSLGERQIGAGHSLLGDGRLAASFQIRDESAPKLQTDLDALAENVIRRFSSAAADPTLSNDDFGMFIDPIAPDTTGFSIGLAGRITLTSLLDPSDQTTLWRLRDGLGAPSPGPVGSSAILTRLLDQLNIPMVIPGMGPQSRSALGHIADLMSSTSTQRVLSDARQAGLQTRAATFFEQFLARGVDSDDQMQRLLLLEKQYAANAKVIATIDLMLRNLLEI